MAGPLLENTDAHAVKVLYGLDPCISKHRIELGRRLGIHDNDLAAHSGSAGTEEEEEVDGEESAASQAATYIELHMPKAKLARPFPPAVLKPLADVPNRYEPIVYTEATTKERVEFYNRLIALERPLIRWNEIRHDVKVYEALNKIVCHVNSHM